MAVHLAATYHQNDMHDEALQAYQLIVRNKLQFPQGGWLRVNMGNIYYQQQKYSQAIKMYRMALDQVPNTNKEVSGCGNLCGTTTPRSRRNKEDMNRTVVNAVQDYR